MSDGARSEWLWRHKGKVLDPTKALGTFLYIDDNLLDGLVFLLLLWWGLGLCGDRGGAPAPTSPHALQLPSSTRALRGWGQEEVPGGRHWFR